MEGRFLNSCKTGDLEGVKAALENGIDVNIISKNRCSISGNKTGLMWALLRNLNHVVEFLLSTPNIDVNYKNWEFETAMHFAVIGDNHEGLAMLLARPEVDVNQKNKFGRSPWMLAVQKFCVDCLNLLLADPRMEPNERSPLPALSYAVMRGDVPLVKFLLESPRTDPNTKDGTEWSKTPLMYAVKENKETMVKILLADPRVDLFTTENFERKDEDLARASEEAGGVLEELVYEKDTKRFPISKLVKVWESGVIKGKILDHLKALCKHKRTLEEAARDPCVGGFAKCRCQSPVGHPHLAKLIVEEKKRRATHSQESAELA